MLAILVPVIFAFLGFAIDLGRLYLVRGELQTAANAAALAAASRLVGTDASLDAAARQSQLTFQDTTGNFSNRYNFGALEVGGTDGFLTSELPTPTFYDTMASALEGGGQAGGATAKYARVQVRAEAPLLFFGFLSLGQERKTAVEVAAMAGQSAPVCTACGIEPVAIAAPDATDTIHFGLTTGTRYTFGFQCTGGAPGPLAPAAIRLPYLLLNRYNEEATLFPDEGSQAYRIGAQGMLPTTIPARSCITINAEETIWVNAAPGPCARVPAPITALTCGLATRFDVTVPGACANVQEVESLAALYQPDSDIADIEDYAAYAGSGRRIITIAVVDALSAAAPMIVLGFRQFLIEPNQDDVTINPGDMNGRFNAIYLGYPAPLRQGSFGACGVTSGPGKVVLHQ